jgi:23S rRNA (adenine2503-C2)-methyltransferase
MKNDIKNYTLPELTDYFKKQNLPVYLAKQIFGWLYIKRKEDFSLMTNISKQTQHYLSKIFYFSKLKLLKKETSRDGTAKFLFGLDDSSSIESVLIPDRDRLTLCISSQVGCKYNCNFCLSAKSGFKRNLSASEIINQYLNIADAIFPKKITNIVFMGIGEPLDNFKNTVKAIKLFREPQGITFGKGRISLSTCGLCLQILELAKLKLGVKLSVSLHSADNQIRSKLMPVNKKYPLAELIKVLKEFSKAENCPVTFEYIILPNLNTTPNDAKKLIKLLKGMNCKINLIPYNTTSSDTEQLSLTQIADFCKALEAGGIFFTLRKSRGQDIAAACGQLRAIWAE